MSVDNYQGNSLKRFLTASKWLIMVFEMKCNVIRLTYSKYGLF